MKTCVRIMATLLLATLLIACDEPVVMLPGGELKGRVEEVPADWSALASIKTIQVETQPEEPYSVNLWIIGTGSTLYLHAGANRATWVEHLESDPRLRLRVGDVLYELRAERVTDAAEFAAFADAYEAKYDRRPRNENVAEAYLFRALPRE